MKSEHILIHSKVLHPTHFIYEEKEVVQIKTCERKKSPRIKSIQIWAAAVAVKRNNKMRKIMTNR